MCLYYEYDKLLLNLYKIPTSGFNPISKYEFVSGSSIIIRLGGSEIFSLKNVVCLGIILICGPIAR